ncbi:MAG: hypothetical protein ABIH00_04860 [Armatimonadota bacterium]
MENKFKLTILLIIIFFFSSFIYVWAAPPLLTEDAGTVGKGNYELELGYQWVNNRDGSTEIFHPFTLNIGVFDNLDIIVDQLQAFISPLDDNIRMGLGDTVISLKSRFSEETEHSPAFGIKTSFDLNDGVESIEMGIPENSTRLFWEKELFGAAFDFNLGYSTSDPCSVLYGVSFDRALAGKWSLVGEVFGESSNNDAGPVISQLGMRYRITDNIIFDASYGCGLTETSYLNQVRAGCVIAFE